MQDRKTTFLLSILIILIVATSVVSSCFIFINNKEKVQALNYLESTIRINNPDQGFYRPIFVSFKKDGATYNKNIINDTTQMYHLRCDISSFSSNAQISKEEKGESILLTEASLSSFKNLLEELKTKSKSCIVRFCYDHNFAGKKDQEPDLNLILSHIEQVCSVMEGYQNTITAIEVGMIGPYGEMHSSKINTKENVIRLIDKFLDCSTHFILVRTPNRIYQYLNLTLDEFENFVVPKTSKAYRLGIFNDGYLGSSSDLGTYINREKEVNFLSIQNQHLPYGGEVTIPSSSFHDIDKCLPEMFKIHLNYLNIEWNNEVISKWQNSYYTSTCGDDEIYYNKTAFEYIENHLGYRLVLNKSTFKYNPYFKELKIKLDLKNVGFGNLIKSKRAKIIFVKDNKICYEREALIFNGTNYNCTIPVKLNSGTYDVYIRIFAEEYQNNPLYCVRFSNDLWNENLKSNLIGKINIQ